MSGELFAHMRLILLSVILAALHFGWGGLAVISRAAEYSPVRHYEKVTGGQLRIEVTAGNAKLIYTAGGFYEWTPTKNQDGSRSRHLFATRFHAETSGSISANYFSVPVEIGNGWAESTEVRLMLDQQLDASNLNPELITPIAFAQAQTQRTPDDVRAWARETEQHNIASMRSPVHILIEEHESGEATCEIYVAPSLLGAGQSSASRLLETPTHFELSQGQVLEKRQPTRESPAPRLPVVHIGAGTGPVEITHSNLRPPGLGFRDPKLRGMQILGDRGLKASGRASVISQTKIMPGTEGGFGNMEVDVNWDFATGKPPDVGWVEASDRGAASWLPEEQSTRRFTVNLKNTKSVEAIRFLLSDVSRHPGIATNMGWAVHDLAVPNSTIVPVRLEAAGTELRWSRTHESLPILPEDSLADLYFDPEQNPAFEIEEGVALPTLGGKFVGFEMSTRVVGRKTTAQVTVADWGASGHLQAEVLMNGFWEKLEARGEIAAEDGVTLQLPLDRNRDGIADAFAKSASGDDGDGFSIFQEYRGAYVGGKHQRLSPGKRDVFVLGTSPGLAPVTRALTKQFNAVDVALHFIRPTEHRVESIAGEPILILEELRDHAFPAVLAVPAEEQSAAWRTLAPREGMTTIFLDDPVSAKYVARDLAKVLGVTLPPPPNPIANP